MFSLLDRYWEQTRLDDLGGLLGSMNPNLFADATPIDEKLVSDWNSLSGERNHITETEGYELMIRFLEEQTDWLDLNSLVSDLKNSFENQDRYWLVWLKLFEQK